MRRLQLFFLLIVLVATPGWRFRCWILCTDQTSTQHDYVEERDHCRDYAQLKLDMTMKNYKGPVNEHTRKELLVGLFSQCMKNKGWNVPGALDVEGNPIPAGQALEQAAAGAAPAIAANPSQAAAAQAQARAAISRSAECNFARYAASTSAIAAARAKACDLECTQRLQAAPEAPRPAACPSGPAPNVMETGRESTE